MQVNASKLELDLMPDHRVVITLRCDSAYEAATTFEEINEAAQSGSISMSFVVANRRVEIDDTKTRKPNP